MSTPAAMTAALRGAWPASRRREEATEEAKAASRVTLEALIGSRLIVWVAAIAALLIFGRNLMAFTIYDPGHLTEPYRASWANFGLAPGARWDSVWYLEIARSGYFSRNSSAFFPLYPLLIRLGSGAFGGPLVVGMVISLASLTVGLYVLYLLARLDMNERAARTTVLLLALFPTALFFSAVYTESLFLALSVGAVYAARRERWALAALLGGLAAATRSNGVLIALPLVLMYLYGPRALAPYRSGAPRWRPRHRLGRSSLWLLLVPAGLVAYLAYLWASHGAPLAPFQVQSAWRREFAGPFGAVIRLVWALPGDVHRIAAGTPLPNGPGDPISLTSQDLIDLGFLLAAVGGLALCWRRLPFAYFAYAFVMLGQTLSEPSSAEPLVSFSRYVLVIFPLFMAAGAWLAERPRTRAVALTSSAALLAGFSGLWAVWGWVG